MRSLINQAKFTLGNRATASINWGIVVTGLLLCSMGIVLAAWREASMLFGA